MQFDFKYSDYFTADDLVKRGYDLMQDGVLDTTHFRSKEDAVDDFLQNAFDVIYDLVVKFRGEKWAIAFFTDMKHTDLTDDAKYYQEKLKYALIQQVIYIYDNGDTQATFHDGRKPYSEKAVNAIWSNILNLGRG